MYPYLPALTGAREIRVPLAEGDVHDLDAMAAEVTAATQLLIVCNPNNPTGDPHPGRRDRRLLRAGPRARDGDPRRGLRRVPDRRRPRRDRSTCSPTSPTWSSCAPSASATASPGCGSATRSARPKFRAAVDAVRQPFSVNALAQAAGAEAILHQDDVAAPGREHDRRAASASRRACASSACATAETPGQLLLDRPRRRRRGGGRRRPRRARDRGPPRHAARRPRPHPRHLRHRRRERALPRRARRAARLNPSTIARPCYNLEQ